MSQHITNNISSDDNIVFPNRNDFAGPSYANTVLLNKLIDDFNINYAIIDLDETLIKSEHIQSKIWADSIKNYIIDNFSITNEALEQLYDYMNTVVNNCFKNGDMAGLLQNIYDALKYCDKKFVAGIYDPASLDKILEAYRVEGLRQACLTGDISVFPGAYTFLDALAYNYGIKTALYTSNQSATGYQLLNSLFGEYANSKLIYKLFGDELPRKIKRKPDIAGFNYCADLFDFNPAETLVIDDSRLSIQNLSNDGKFGLLLGISHGLDWNISDWQATPTKTFIIPTINDIY